MLAFNSLSNERTPGDEKREESEQGKMLANKIEIARRFQVTSELLDGFDL